MSVLKLSALKGLFANTLTENVSYVNAPLFAEERGMQVRLLTDPVSDDYRNVITLKGADDDRRDALRLRHPHRGRSRSPS